jgi:hypothetical protein
MSESEAKTLTTTSTSKRGLHPDPKAKIRSELAVARLHKHVLQVTGPPPGPPTNVKQSAKVTSRGRKPTEYTQMLAKALGDILRTMPQGGTLEDWSARLKDKGIKTPLADRADGCPPEYPGAIKNPKFYNRIRLRIRKIVGKKLLPKK